MRSNGLYCFRERRDLHRPLSESERDTGLSGPFSGVSTGRPTVCILHERSAPLITPVILGRLPTCPGSKKETPATPSQWYWTPGDGRTGTAWGATHTHTETSLGGIPSWEKPHHRRSYPTPVAPLWP